MVRTWASSGFLGGAGFAIATNLPLTFAKNLSESWTSSRQTPPARDDAIVQHLFGLLELLCDRALILVGRRLAALNRILRNWLRSGRRGALRNPDGGVRLPLL